MIANTIKQLSNYINIGERFKVINGSWIGHIVSKNKNGLIIDIYDHNNIVRNNVLLNYDYNCDLSIIKLRRIT